MKRIACFILALVHLFLFVGCQNLTHEEALLKDAKELRSYFDDIVKEVENEGESLDIEINKLSDSKYEVTLFGRTQQNVFEHNNEESEPIDELYELTEEHMKLADKAKDKVISYINNSSVLKDKEILVEKINSVERKATFLNSAVGIYKDNVIYLNYVALETYSEDICIYAIIHEYIHAIADFTNGGIDNEVYGKKTINEAMTDIICYQIFPKNTAGEYGSAYQMYYDFILIYIDCFKEQAIEAYYYGYDTIWEKTGKDEFDFFVEMFANAPKNQYAFACYVAIMNKWYQL